MTTTAKLGYNDYDLVAITREATLRCSHCLTGVEAWPYGDPTIQELMTAVDRTQHVCESSLVLDAWTVLHDPQEAQAMARRIAKHATV